MRLIQIVILLFLIVLISCQEVNKRTEQQSEKITKNTDDEFIKNKYFENGNLKSAITVKNMKKNGIAKKYYKTGEIHTSLYYVNNIKEGEAIWYFKNGSQYRVTNYVNDKIEGIRKIYYEDGTPQAEIPYKNDKPVEGLKEYKKNGKLITSYPEIIFETKNSINVDRKIILFCKISNNAKKVDFYHEVTYENRKILSALKTNNGIAQIDFFIPETTTVNREIIVQAELKSSLGHPYITKKTYNLKVNSN